MSNFFLKLFVAILSVLCINVSIAQSGRVKSADGTEISYTVKGRGNVAVIFVHGWNFDKSLWTSQIEAVSKKYKAVALDLAGHGKSGTKRTNYTMKAFGRDVAAVANHLKLSKIILVGHSVGGAVILEAYKLLKPKVIGLIGADVYQKLDAGETDERAEGFLKPFVDDYKNSVGNYAETLLDPYGDRKINSRVIKTMLAGSKTMGLSLLRNLYRYNYIEAVKQVEVPIITINSSKYITDENFNKSYMKSLYEVKVVPDSDHFLMLGQEKKFNQFLLESLEKIVMHK